MNKEELEERAEELYNACPTVKPTWQQLGDVTRSVWVAKARKLIEAEQDGD